MAWQPPKTMQDGDQWTAPEDYTLVGFCATVDPANGCAFSPKGSIGAYFEFYGGLGGAQAGWVTMMGLQLPIRKGQIYNQDGGTAVLYLTKP